ncbi:MAG: SDR family oxidoreductase [Spirochaetia bacterium]|nr:SDR family oxidoreductase [Spirochaetia bacterium]
MGSNMGRNIIITGATSGIGLSCAKLFCEKGNYVFGVSRSGTCSTYSHTHFYTSVMDVTDDKSVVDSIHTIQKHAITLTSSGIDMVIHCAGYGIAGSAEDTPIERVIEQFDTNYFGVLRVNSALLPLLREQEKSTVIVIGSIAGKISIPFQSHYSATKYALESYVDALRMESKPYGVKATIVEAGDTVTPFNKSRTYYGPPSSLYREVGMKSVAKMEKDEANGYSPDKVAAVVYKVSEKKNPPPRVAVGISYKLLMLLKRVLPDRIIEKIISMMYT